MLKKKSIIKPLIFFICFISFISFKQIYAKDTKYSLEYCNKPVKYTKGKNIIVSNYVECAKIGKKILNKGGNGVDAAIGVMLCEGVAKPQDMGLGGGFLGIVKLKNKTFIINAREIAPLNLSVDSFKKDTSNTIFGKTIGIPSALKGYGTLHNQYGKMKWEQICYYVEKMCKEGFKVIIGDILEKKQYQYLEELNRHIFINPKTLNIYKNNETWKRPDLAKTLKLIGKYGPNFFYTSPIKEEIMHEINDQKGVITSKDFDEISTYKLLPHVSYFTFNNKKIKLETTSLPGGGPILSFILQIMEEYYKQYKNITYTHKLYVMTEAFKFGFAFRTSLGDPRFSNMDHHLKKLKNKKFIKSILKKIIQKNKTINNNPEYYLQQYNFKADAGTANIVIKTKNEIICLTSTINLRFGSWVISKFGFVYNNQMSDFSLPNRIDAGHLPPALHNFPAPGKWPISSISTSIISIYNGKIYKPKYVLGAAGGPKIITSLIQVIDSILRDNNIVKAIANPRYHHQLVPDVIQCEKEIYKKNFKSFIKTYNYTLAKPFMRGDYSAVTGIEIHNDNYLSGSFDPRRPGGVCIF